MALLPKEQAAVDEALKRGMSQQKINTFLAENPNDYSRLRTQKTDAEIRAEEESRGYFRDKKASTPAAAPQAAATTPLAPATAPAPTDAPMAGLTAIAPEPATASSMPMLGGGGGAMLEPEPPAPMGVATTALGQLRNLGRRTPPMSQYAFSGLKDIY